MIWERMLAEITTRNNRLWLDDVEGVARGCSTAGAIETGENAVENLAALRKLVGDKPRPFLIDIRQAKGFAREARALYSGPEPIGAWTACALLVGSPLTRTMANFFFAVNRPVTPCRVFTDETEALKWLRTFRAP